MALLRKHKNSKKEIEKAKSYRDDFLKRSKKMSNKFEDFLNEQLKDPKVKKNMIRCKQNTH